MTPIQRIKRLREHYPHMRLWDAKYIVDTGQDDAMVEEQEAKRCVRDAAPTLLEAAESLLAADDATPASDAFGLTTAKDLMAHHERWVAARNALRAAVQRARGQS